MTTKQDVLKRVAALGEDLHHHQVYNTDVTWLLTTLRRELEINAVLEEALKRAEGYMFMACQPNQGELFGEFDDLNLKALDKTKKMRAE